MKWTKGQWPDAITTGEIEYSRGSSPHLGQWYALRDSSHGIPVFGSVRASDDADNLAGQEVRVFNYPGQTESIAAQLTHRWNSHPKLVDMLRVCIAELRELGADTVPTQAENLLNEIDN